MYDLQVQGMRVCNQTVPDDASDSFKLVTATELYSVGSCTWWLNFYVYRSVRGGAVCVPCSPEWVYYIMICVVIGRKLIYVFISFFFLFTLRRGTCNYYYWKMLNITVWFEKVRYLFTMILTFISTYIICLILEVLLTFRYAQTAQNIYKCFSHNTSYYTHSWVSAHTLRRRMVTIG